MDRLVFDVFLIFCYGVIKVIDTLSRSLTQKLLDANIINFDDNEIYIYGFQLLFATIFKGIGLLIIGIIADCLLEMFIYIVFFSSLRVYAGGFHNQTYIGCFLLTTFSVSTSIFISRMLNPLGYTNLLIVIMILSVMVIFLHAPVANPNRPLSKKEVSIFKIKARFVSLIQSFVIISIILFKAKFTLYAYIGTFAMLSESISLLPLFNINLKEGH